MRAKKYAIIITAIMSFISIIVLVTLYFRIYSNEFKELLRNWLPVNLSDLREFGILISSGIFTGVFTTLVISIWEYLNERKNTLITYYDANEDLLYRIMKVDYLYINVPVKLLKAYYNEEDNNRRYGNIDKSILKTLDKAGRDVWLADEEDGASVLKLQYKAKNELMNWIWEKGEVKDLKAHRRKKYLESELQKLIRDYNKQMDKIMKQYISISETSFKSLENAYGAIDFMFDKGKNKQKSACGVLYEIQTGMLASIKNTVPHFRDYYAFECGNRSVMLDKILELQEKIYETRCYDNKTLVYKKHQLDVDIELHRLSKLIYGNKFIGCTPQKEYYIYKMYS